MPEQGDPQRVMLTRSDLVGKKYVQIGTPLIAKLGGDAGAAAMAIVVAGVELRIQWNGEERADGHVWWKSSIEALADDTGLGYNTVRRSLDKLVAKGVLVRERFEARRSDQTYSYRVVLVDGEPDTRLPEHPVDKSPSAAPDVPNVLNDHLADVPDADLADVPDHHVADVPDLPSSKKGRRESRPLRPRAVDDGHASRPWPEQCVDHQDEYNEKGCFQCGRARTAHQANVERERKIHEANRKRCPIEYHTGFVGTCSNCRADELAVT